MTWWIPTGLPAHPVTQPGQISSQPRSQVSQSRVSHIAFHKAAVRQKQPELVPLRRDPKGTPGLLSPHSPSTPRSHSSSQAPCICSVTQCPPTQLVTSIFLPCVIKAFCLGLPPELNLQFTNQVTFLTKRKCLKDV